jgi:SAM-dependent methyltransferase
MSATPSQPVDVLRGTLEQLMTGYSLSAIVFAAVELRLFERLGEGPALSDELALRMGASPRGVARLCTALAALGLLHHEHDGRFAAVPGTAELLGEGEGSLRPVVLHHQRHLAPLMMRLPDAVRHARPQHAAWSFASPGAAQRHCYDELSRHPEEYALFLEAMDRTSAGVGDDIAQAFELQRIRRLIDLGGGSGRVARELLAAAPHLELVLLDLEPACRVAERKAAEAALGERFHATVVDFRRPLAEAPTAPGDVVLLSGILADFSVEHCREILANAERMLRPEGVLLVSETLLDDARTGPLVPALLSLLMLAAMPGDSFTRVELSSLLQGSGFVVERHVPPRAPGRRDLLVCRRAGSMDQPPSRRVSSTLMTGG